MSDEKKKPLDLLREGFTKCEEQRGWWPGSVRLSGEDASAIVREMWGPGFRARHPHINPEDYRTRADLIGATLFGTVVVGVDADQTSYSKDAPEGQAEEEAPPRSDEWAFEIARNEGVVFLRTVRCPACKGDIAFFKDGAGEELTAAKGGAASEARILDLEAKLAEAERRAVAAEAMASGEARSNQDLRRHAGVELDWHRDMSQKLVNILSEIATHGLVVTAVGGKPEVSFLSPALPEVHLVVNGDVASAEGPGWSIYCEREGEDRSRCRVKLDGHGSVDVTVHSNGNALEDETQEVCAALLWSMMRAREIKGAESVARQRPHPYVWKKKVGGRSTVSHLCEDWGSICDTVQNDGEWEEDPEADKCKACLRLIGMGEGE